jgi:hypothetical protein
MESTFTITEEEYVKANKLFTRPTKKIINVYIISSVILITLFILTDTMIYKITVIGALFGGFIGQFIVRHVYAPWQTKKQFKVYKAIQEPVTVLYSESGLEFKEKTGRGTIEWNRIYKWRENNNLLLLYQAPGVYHIIPKRAGEIVIKIQEALSQHVGKAT